MVLEARTMRSAEWQKYRDFRLKALRENPDRFDKLYEEEKDLPDKFWKETIAEADKIERFWLFFAWDTDLGPESIPIGMISALKSPNAKTSHIVTISGPFVSVKEGGRGVERKMISYMLSKLSNDNTIKKLRCFIKIDDPEKLALYQQEGFKIIGEMEQEFKLKSGGYMNEYILEKIVS